MNRTEEDSESTITWANMAQKDLGFATVNWWRSCSDESLEAGLTVNELVLAFMRYAEGHYGHRCFQLWK